MSDPKALVIALAFVIMVSVSAFFIITSMGQPTPTVPSPFPQVPSTPSPLEITSVYAFQDPNNPSQASALAIIVQLNGTNSVDFTPDRVAVSLVTDPFAYSDVYLTSDFVNASTFNNTYGANFTRYQVVAPNCSIIEINGNGGNQTLEPGETFAIFLNLNSSYLNCPLSVYPNEWFNIMLSVYKYAAVTFSGSVPTNITPVMNITD